MIKQCNQKSYPNPNRERSERKKFILDLKMLKKSKAQLVGFDLVH